MFARAFFVGFELFYLCCSALCGSFWRVFSKVSLVLFSVFVAISHSPKNSKTGVFIVFSAIWASPGQLPDSSRTAPGQLPDSSRTVPGQLPDGSRTAPGRLPDGSRTAPGRLPDGSRTAHGQLTDSSRTARRLQKIVVFLTTGGATVCLAGVLQMPLGAASGSVSGRAPVRVAEKGMGRMMVPL